MSLLSVKNLGKSYRTYSSEWKRFASWFGVKTEPSEEHWVMRNVNFTIKSGEAVGIIGQNGAGKSTLLKMITGTLQPTEGQIHINGRIAAILELGMGFNPELSGRENVYHAAGLMGFSVEKIQQMMSEIEAFAEIGEYFDEPIRTYSSGMQMRVAFSVATAYRPELLIVDEALSVGDIFFQQKCFTRIREYCKKGTTLLFVSHSLDSVFSLCDRAILLKDGELILDDKPKVVIDVYNAHIVQQTNPESLALDIRPQTKKAANKCNDSAGSYYSKSVQINSVSLQFEKNDVNSIISESKVDIHINITFFHKYKDPHVGFQIRNSRGEIIFMTNTFAMKKSIGPVQKGYILDIDFSLIAALAEGQYTITAGVANEGRLNAEFEESLARKQNACAFSVLKNHDAITWAGVCNLAPTCEYKVSIADKVHDQAQQD